MKVMVALVFSVAFGCTPDVVPVTVAPVSFEKTRMSGVAVMLDESSVSRAVTQCGGELKSGTKWPIDAREYCFITEECIPGRPNGQRCGGPGPCGRSQRRCGAWTECDWSSDGNDKGEHLSGLRSSREEWERRRPRDGSWTWQDD